MTTSIVTRIKEDQLAARKDRNVEKGKFLALLLSEIAKIGKSDGNRESTDVEAIAEVKKFINNNASTRKFIIEKNEDTTADETRLSLKALEDEDTLLYTYLPPQLTETEMITELNKFKDLPSFNLGAAQGHFKANFAGRYDGSKLASIITTQFPDLVKSKSKPKAPK